MIKTQAKEAHPSFPWIEIDQPDGIERFLRHRGWITDQEQWHGCERAGEGNMNLTVRIRTDRRTLIVKQARPWVEKYPQIPAPWDRGEYERRFYQRVATIPHVAARMPRLLDSDPEAAALLLEDLADATDLTFVYGGHPLKSDEISDLAKYLAALHSATRGETADRFANRKMRRLNHEHLFVVPLSPENGLDLDALEAGLAGHAAALRSDKEYRRLVNATADRYLEDGSCLVHGDYFPGSWLRTPGGVRVIVREYSFFGHCEVDVGCAVAHFALAGQAAAVADDFLNAYIENTGSDNVRRDWLTRYASVEVMRRLIGVAQFPLSREFGRAKLLERSRQAMLTQDWTRLWH